MSIDEKWYMPRPYQGMIWCLVLFDNIWPQVQNNSCSLGFVPERPSIDFLFCWPGNREEKESWGSYERNCGYSKEASLHWGTRLWSKPLSCVFGRMSLLEDQNMTMVFVLSGGSPYGFEWGRVLWCNGDCNGQEWWAGNWEGGAVMCTFSVPVIYIILLVHSGALLVQCSSTVKPPLADTSCKRTPVWGPGHFFKKTLYRQPPINGHLP